MKNKTFETESANHKHFHQDPKSVVHAIFKAYETHDRALAESVLADDFSFTSPLDNHLSRDAYFKICWPNNKSARRFDIQALTTDGDTVFVIYDMKTDDKKSRNCEKLTVKNGKITTVEVYFGWDLPHPVSRGEHEH